MKKDNLNTKAYKHFVSFVKEIIGKEKTMEFANDVQNILNKIKYKNKSYYEILKECNVIKETEGESSGENN